MINDRLGGRHVSRQKVLVSLQASESLPKEGTSLSFTLDGEAAFPCLPRIGLTKVP
jgi:hypothetical protein